MMTVLPTPAPPNRPILPPFTNGAIRSITLIPVSNTSVLGSRSTNFGVSRWMGHRSAVAGMIDHHRVVELGEVLRLELHVEHGPDHLDDLSDIRCARRLLCLVLLLVRHRSPGSRGLGVRDSGIGSFRVPSPEPPVPSLSMLPLHPRSPPTPA